MSEEHRNALLMAKNNHVEEFEDTVIETSQFRNEIWSHIIRKTRQDEAAHHEKHARQEYSQNWETVSAENKVEAARLATVRAERLQKIMAIQLLDLNSVTVERLKALNTELLHAQIDKLRSIDQALIPAKTSKEFKGVRGEKGPKQRKIDAIIKAYQDIRASIASKSGSQVITRNSSIETEQQGDNGAMLEGIDDVEMQYEHET
jgi:hypothetical protein